ncbi:hypothetical protein FOYG_08979 [Fusarium oxysporum NRRL 32931]|uniref:Cytochrome P450 oxidoreductase n=1 Tax=Fusarium oxysporum NRRL 32931 TaxID=660029 RepID=W9IGX0_FUSOX|nr:hypothetical protein FOYG_08979 [Fusarium oxysporum NRRL 32931]
MFNRLLSTEVILEFAIARPADLIGEDPNGFRSWFLDAFDLASQSIIELQHSLLLRIFTKSMPRWVIKIVSKEAEKLLDMNEYAESSLNSFKRRSELPDHPVVFESLKTLPDRLCIDEAQDIMVAGADTTAFTLTTGTFHVLSDPSIHKKLVAVLEEDIAQNEEFPTLMTLEKIPYLVSALCCCEDGDGSRDAIDRRQRYNLWDYPKL